MKSFIIVFLLITFTSSMFSQHYALTKLVRSVVVNKVDSTMHFDVLNKCDIKKANERKSYFWYAKNNIHKNMGGYSGYLLHGDFQVFDLNGNLITKGKFEDGLKIGRWEEWFSDGNLKRSELWKDGVLYGDVLSYYPNGKLKCVEKYKDSKKSGVHYYYSDDGILVKKVNYRKGLKHGKEIIYLDHEKPHTLLYKDGVVRLPVVKKVETEKDDTRKRVINFHLRKKQKDEKDTKSISKNKIAKTAKDKERSKIKDQKRHEINKNKVDKKKRKPEDDETKKDESKITWWKKINLSKHKK